MGAAIIPFFETSGKRIGESSRSEVEFKHLCRVAARLESLARQLDVVPLTQFESYILEDMSDVFDKSELEQLRSQKQAQGLPLLQRQWFTADKALNTTRTLLCFLRVRPNFWNPEEFKGQNEGVVRDFGTGTRKSETT